MDKVGRPPREFSDEQVERIGYLAYLGCQTLTIANLTGIPEATLRAHFDELLKQNRARRKEAIRVRQLALMEDENPKAAVPMAIFLGKNDLGQSDRQTVDINTTGTVKIVDPRLDDEPGSPSKKGELPATGGAGAPVEPDGG